MIVIDMSTMTAENNDSVRHAHRMGEEKLHFGENIVQQKFGKCWTCVEGLKWFWFYWF